MAMEVKSLYYNYYNVKGRYTPETPQIPAWRKTFEVVEDRIESNNRSQDSDLYKAYVKLEDIYYDKAVRNRAKYKDENSLRQALSEEYLFGDKYK